MRHVEGTSLDGRECLGSPETSTMSLHSGDWESGRARGP